MSISTLEDGNNKIFNMGLATIHVYGDKVHPTNFSLIVDGGVSMSSPTTNSSTVQSVSTSTGAYTSLGGVGIAKNLYIGGVERIVNTTQSTDSNSGALVVDGGVGIKGNLYCNKIYGDIEGSETYDSLHLSFTTNSSSVSTGTLIVDGGEGLAKDLYVGGTIYGNLNGSVTGTLNVTDLHLTGTTQSTASSTGTLIVDGGVGIEKDLYVGGKIYGDLEGDLTVDSLVLSDTTQSSSSSTGTLTVAGGAGIAKNINIGGTITGNNILTLTAPNGTLPMNITKSDTNATYIDWTGSNFRQYLHIGSQSTNGSKLTVTNKAGDEQLLLFYDPTHFCQFFVDSSGNTTIDTSGNIMNFASTDQINILNTTESTSISTGALVVNGGEGITKNLYVGGTIYGNVNGSISGTVNTSNLHLTGTTQSTSPSTGTLIVDGGEGVAKDLIVGGNMTSKTHTIYTPDGLKSGSISIIDTIGDMTISPYTGQNVRVAGQLWAISNNGSQVIASYDGITYGYMSVNASGQCRIQCSGSDINIGSANQFIVLNTSVSTSYTTGSMIVNGGIGCAGAIYVNDGTQSSGAGSGAVVIAGGLGVARNINSNGVVYAQQANFTSSTTPQLTLAFSPPTGKTVTFTVDSNGDMLTNCGGNDWFVDQTDLFHLASTTNPTSTSTGALQLLGGCGMAKDLYVGGIIYNVNTSDAFSYSTGALQLSGGASILKNLYVNGKVFNTNTTQSTSATTGALTVDGGAGIAKDVFVGGSIYSAGVLVPTITSTTVNVTLSGPWASSQTTSCTLTKVGDVVTLTLTGTGGTVTSNTGMYSNAFIPVSYRPSATRSGLIAILANAGYSYGYYELSTGGSIGSIAPFGGWTIGSSSGIWNVTITYNI